MTTEPNTTPEPNRAGNTGAVLPVLFWLSASHMMNDLIQSLLPAIYPLLKSELSLNFTQVGLITFTFQLTASLLQPIIGIYTDRHPKPFSLAIGMGCSLIGLLLLSYATSFALVLIAAGIIGTGSSIFHPEASRIARFASGGRHGFAQSLFQVGGNSGSAIGPLLAALIVVPNGQGSIAWFSCVALIGIILLYSIGRWYKPRLVGKTAVKKQNAGAYIGLSTTKIVVSIIILLILTFSKNFYMVSLSSYYTFFLMHKFQVSIPNAQILLFVFLGSVALGTFIGGPLGDRFGRKLIIWISILGVLPFTLALPYANLPFTIMLTILIGFILASAFSAIVVFAQDLLPGNVGMVAGLFFGFAFGAGGVGAAILGIIADRTSIDFVYLLCSFIPAIGILVIFLPRRATKTV